VVLVLTMRAARRPRISLMTSATPPLHARCDAGAESAGLSDAGYRSLTLMRRLAKARVQILQFLRHCPYVVRHSVYFHGKTLKP
jgi:hypothetical protein